jgi:hypothetical protein
MHTILSKSRRSDLVISPKPAARHCYFVLPAIGVLNPLEVPARRRTIITPILHIQFTDKTHGRQSEQSKLCLDVMGQISAGHLPAASSLMYATDRVSHSQAAITT